YLTLELYEQHRLDFLMPGIGLRRPADGVVDRIADAGISEALDSGHHVADLAGCQPLRFDPLGREDADFLDLEHVAATHHADLHARLDRAVTHTRQDRHALVILEPGIEHERLERPPGIARRRRDALPVRL